MTLYEYEIRMTAQQLKMIDKQEEIHQAAWANRQVMAEMKKGKKTVYRFDRFNKFFNKKKLEKEVLGIEEKKDSKLLSLMKKANS